MDKARIIILNYNGVDLLERCMPSLVQAAKQAAIPTKVTVLDNRSSDASLELLKRDYPEVDIWIAPENRVLCSYNDYLKTISEPIVVLLNNDIRVEPNFLDSLCKKFKEDPKTFLVAPKVMSFDGSSIEAGRSIAKLRYGLWWCEARYPDYEKDATQPSATFSSGFGAFSRETFLALGGYDDRYLPGIFEDVDICYRAAQAGYSLYYEPESVVYHMGQASFKKKFGSFKILVLAHRNNFLFLWKNLNSFKFWFQHALFLPLRFILSLVKEKGALLIGFFQALKRSKEIAK